MRAAYSASTARRRGDPRRALGACASAIALSLVAAAADAAPAGSDIANTAQIDAIVAGAPLHLLSNTVHTTLGELLDVRLSPVGPQPEQVAPVDTGHVSTFTLTNAGNGQEAFALTATVSGIDATVGSIWIDGDGDGRFDAAHDTRLPSGGASPMLASGAAIAVFVLSDIASTVTAGSNGTVTLTATSRTGSGAPGAAFAQAGDGGGDAVVGATTAAATAEIRLAVGDMGATLVKSQTVATAGGGQPGSGSIVTYTLEARFTAAVAGARIADPLPAATTYVANSLRLDGAALSDVADGDAGAFDAVSRTVAVALGDPSATTVRTVSFQVRIN